jgi:hypothetical protein
MFKQEWLQMQPLLFGYLQNFCRGRDQIYDLYLQSGLLESSAAVVLLLVTLSTFLVFRAVANARRGSERP